MESLGFAEKLESDHELIWQKPSAYIELHKRLIPSYNQDYYAYYGEGWNLAKKCDGTRYSMTDEDQMIYLFTILPNTIEMRALESVTLWICGYTGKTNLPWTRHT